jgi:hypothetical protein
MAKKQTQTKKCCMCDHSMDIQVKMTLRAMDDKCAATIQDLLKQAGDLIRLGKTPKVIAAEDV